MTQPAVTDRQLLDQDGEDPYLREEHVMLRESVRRFVETEVKPHGEQWEEDGFVPRPVMRRMGELGFLGIRYPEEYGGAGMDTLGSVVFAEELGKSTFGGFAVTALVHTDMASPHLVNAGSKAQLDRYLPDIIAGKTICAIGVTEPDAGSDVAGIRSRARRDGTDWVLNGTKMFITNGVMADVYFIAAKTDPDVKGTRGISIFIVDKGTPGFSVGRSLKKHGWLSSDTAELVFEDVRVPAENLLGEENRGFYAVMRNFQNERSVLAAQALGECAAAMALTLDYCGQRKAFGSTLWEKPAIRQRMAALAGKIEAGRRLVYHTAWMASRDRECVREVSMAKAYCGELVNEVLYTCMQFHGGFGYLREAAIERMTRDARIQSIGGGTTEIMLEEVAKRMQG